MNYFDHPLEKGNIISDPK